MNEWTPNERIPLPSREDETKTLSEMLREYLAAARRRKWYLIVPAVVILSAAAVVAKTLPPTYRSTGKILIEQQEIPKEWVPASVTGFAGQRIQAISQRVLSTDNLTHVIEKLNLYAEQRQEATTEALVGRMRNSFNISMIDAKRGGATIAFSVSFDHHTPEGAQKAANELVSLYLDENAKQRTEAVADSTRFLKEEADRLADELSQMEARIAEFKEKNMGRLPEQQDLNLRLLQRAEQTLQETRRRIESMEERKIYLESALAQIRNQPAGTEAGESSARQTDLPSLRARYASLSSIYSKQHPDMVRLRRLIDALEQSSTDGDPSSIDAKMHARRQELAAMKERYADDHPDIVRLRNEISALAQRRGEASSAPNLNGAQNPTLVKTQADLNAIESELETLRKQEREYEEKVENIETRISEIPRAEQEYRQLIRDHENMLAKYRDIRAKQSSARVAESLERDQKGERFTLIESPQVPNGPIKPDRFKILVLGIAGSFIGGFGAAFVREELDDSVRSSRAVSEATHAPVLGVIPVIGTPGEERRARRTRLLILAAVPVAVAGAATAVHFYYRPLDLLGYELVQKGSEYLGALENLWGSL